MSESASVQGMELTTDVGCLEMYKQFVCRYNFPLCDLETGKSEKICPSECVAFHLNCGLSAAMCSSRFFPNMEEESPSCEFAPEVEEPEEEE